MFQITGTKTFAFCAFWVGVVLLNGCIPPAQTTLSSSTVVTLACPPLPTRTPDLRPTTTPRRTPPTSAPTPTQGPPPPLNTSIPPATLAQPLTNQTLVLSKLFEFEKESMSRWDEPWCVETLQFDPDRILFARYETVNQYYHLSGGWARNGDDEPVWVVTIRGPVLPLMIGWRTSDKAAYQTFIMGEQSGMFYGFSAGLTWPPKTNLPPATRDLAKTTRPPRTKVPRVTTTP